MEALKMEEMKGFAELDESEESSVKGGTDASTYCWGYYPIYRPVVRYPSYPCYPSYPSYPGIMPY
jgi:hypothetical protein